MLLRSFIRSISTNVIRQQRQRPSRVFREKHALPVNPGIKHRLSAMDEDGEDVAVGPEMDLFDDVESDFSEVHKSHRQHEFEMERHNELLKRRIVSQKYFDDYSPNFLTWSEKEHMRHLHMTDPQEWTVERLAQSFPVDEKGAEKIINVVWKPASQSRIERHDASALRNWKQLKSGVIEDMSTELKAHVLKFTKRVIPPRSVAATKESQLIDMKKKPVGEFGSIVLRAPKISNDNTVKQLGDASDIKYTTDDIVRTHSSEPHLKKLNLNTPAVTSGETYNKDGFQINTLDGLRRNIIDKSEESKDISLLDKLIISPINQDNSVESSDLKKSNLNIPEVQTKMDESALFRYQDQSEILPAENIHPQIKIPVKVWKEGGTYKVGDCFYDDDGSFLYRVPGMVNRVK